MFNKGDGDGLVAAILYAQAPTKRRNTVRLSLILLYGIPVWYILVFSSLAVVTVISNISVMCIWLKPKVRSHVTILLAALSLSDSITVIIPGVCLPIALN